jgi:hypothetical protein
VSKKAKTTSGEKTESANKKDSPVRKKGVATKIKAKRAKPIYRIESVSESDDDDDDYDE